MIFRAISTLVLGMAFVVGLAVAMQPLGLSDDAGAFVGGCSGIAAGVVGVIWTLRADV